MSATGLDQKGIVESCRNCGQRNRIAYERLGKIVRCGRCKAELPGPDAPLDISEASAFRALIANSSIPVLVDFWADWCGPCKMMAPELKRVAIGNAGRCVVAKVNTEGMPMLAQQYLITALPTLALFIGGAEIGAHQIRALKVEPLQKR